MFVSTAFAFILGSDASEPKLPPTATSRPVSKPKVKVERTVDKKVKVVPEIKKEPLNVTTDTLTELLNENALKAATTYKDQYVRLKGKLSNIDAQGHYFSLTSIKQEFSFDMIMCYIGKEHLDQVMEFISGQEVILTGTISNVGEVIGYSVDVERIE